LPTRGGREAEVGGGDVAQSGAGLSDGGFADLEGGGGDALAAFVGVDVEGGDGDRGAVGGLHFVDEG